MFKEKLVIDIMKRNYSKIQCLIGDTLELDIDILANGVPFDIESFDILIEQGLENGKFNIQSDGITKNKNNLVCFLSNKFTSIKGKHSIDISIIKSKYKKTTFKIPFEVYEGAIEESSTEQEIFVSILGELREEIVKSQNAKTELSTKIQEAKNSNTNLNNIVNSANETKTELSSKIEESKNSNTSLSGVINTANETKTELSSKIEESKNSNTSLSEVINTANETKTELSSKAEEAKNVNNTLNQNIQNGNIEQIKKDLQGWIDFKGKGGEIGGSITLKDSSYLYSSTIANPTGELGIGAQDKKIWFGMLGGTSEVAFRPQFVDKGMYNIGYPNYEFKDLYLIGHSRNTTGFSKLTNGLILQWGKLDKSHIDGNINFPITFPSMVFYLTSSLLYDSDKWSGRTYTQPINNSRFRLVHLERHPTNPATPIWFAVGM